MRYLRLVFVALILVLLPTLMQAKVGGGPVAEVSPYCAQFACPNAYPTVACRCACDVVECDCAENCARGNFFCKQQCRNQLNNCYVACG